MFASENERELTGSSWSKLWLGSGANLIIRLEGCDESVAAVAADSCVVIKGEQIVHAIGGDSPVDGLRMALASQGWQMFEMRCKCTH